MVQRSPCEAYTKYLIIRGKSNEEIREHLLERELDYLTNRYMGSLRSSLTRLKPDPFYPTDRYHNPSQEFLHKAGVHRLFFENDAVRGAYRILGTPRAKEMIEALSMAGVPVNALAGLVRSRLKISVTVADVEAFLTYFWNIALVRSVDLKLLIEARHLVFASDENDDDEKKLTSLVRKSLADDPRYLAAVMPHSPASAMIAQGRMGFLPNQAELARLVEMTRFLSVSRALESVAQGNSEAAANFMNIGVRATDMLQSVVRPDDELRADLSKLALKAQRESEVPLLSDLFDRKEPVPPPPDVDAPMDFDPPEGDDGVEEDDAR